MVFEHSSVLHSSADVCVLFFLAAVGPAALPVKVRADVERGSPSLRYQGAESAA